MPHWRLLSLVAIAGVFTIFIIASGRVIVIPQVQLCSRDYREVPLRHTMTSSLLRDTYTTHISLCECKTYDCDYIVHKYTTPSHMILYNYDRNYTLLNSTEYNYKKFTTTIRRYINGELIFMNKSSA
jgi:hypothetical protein